MSISDDYENWQRRLAGEELPIYEDEPECGFYKVRLAPRSKQYLPVAIWHTKKRGFRAMKNRRLMNASDIWLAAIKNPISEHEYEILMEVYHG